MPKRPRSTRIEDENRTAFEEALGEFFVYREQRRDIGVDGEVEIFDGDDATGHSFAVQLRGTDAKDVKRALRLRLPHSQVAYWNALSRPVLLVRYVASSRDLYVRWLHSYDRYFDGEASNATLPLPLRESDRLTTARRDRLAAEVRAFRRLRSASLPQPLTFQLVVDGGGLTSFEVSTALSRENRTPELVELAPHRQNDFTFRVTAESLSADLAGVTGATVHLESPDDSEGIDAAVVARTLFALVALALGRVGHDALVGRLTRAYFATSLVALDLDAGMSMSHAMTRARQVREALEVSEVLDKIDEDGDSSQPFLLPALVHAQSLDADENNARFDVLRSRIRRRIDRDAPKKAAAESVSLGNALRHAQAFDDALEAFSAAERLDPAYGQRPHFHNERGGTLFLAARYREAADAYRAALDLGDPPFTRALYGDALLFSGHYEAAAQEFTAYLGTEGEDDQRRAEYVLKVELCQELRRRGFKSQVRDEAVANKLADRAARERDAAESRALAERALRADAVNGLAWFNLAVALSEQDAPDAALAWRLAALVTEWDPESWSNALLSAGPQDPIDEMLLTARRFTAGAVFDRIASEVRLQPNGTSVLENLQDVLAQLPPEPEADAGIRFVGETETEILQIPRRQDSGD